METGTWIILIAVAAVVFAAIGIALGMLIHGKRIKKTFSDAEDEAKRMSQSIISDAEKKSADRLAETRSQIEQEQRQHEKKMEDTRQELRRQESRQAQRETDLEKREADFAEDRRSLRKKEEALEKKVKSTEEALAKKVKTAEEQLAKKEEMLDKKLQENEERQQEIEKLRQQEITVLEQLSGLTREQAKQLLLELLQSDLDAEKARKFKQFEQELREASDRAAREIIATAIQRCAADHTSEVTVSSVDLPNDDMKGRIIGREGRNIRRIEELTGVDLIIDDTPEAITVSSFDPVKREIARLTIEKLIADGRIHPARIEEMFEKAKREVEQTVKQAGEQAVIEAGVNGVNGELIRILGRLKYRTSYGQNVLNHSLEVSYLAGLMAAEIGADVKAAKRAGLLHDIGKALDQTMEGTHISIGVEIARKYKEKEDILHAIEAHHGDVEARTVVAVLVQAADAISAARPGARRENLQSYIKRLEELEAICKGFGGVNDAYAIQAGREVRIIVNPDKITDDRMTILAREIAEKIENELDYPGQIKVNIIRERRVTDVAK